MNPESALVSRAQVGGMVEVAQSRAAQEVQAAMIVAKRDPRDTVRAYNRIIEACKRKSLAEVAAYAYPRGGETVSGPTVHLARTIAQCWGNVDYGIVELESRTGMGETAGESTMLAYAWDLETNTRSTKIFTVRHKRDTRSGSKLLRDERDIYEISANNGARRLRACILDIIPGDIVDAAVEQCDKTLAGGSKEPLVDRVRAMVVRFGEIGVSQQMIERRLGHRLEVTTETELVQLARIFSSIRDNAADRESFFEFDHSSPVQSPSRQADEKIDPVQSAPPPAPRSLKNFAPGAKQTAPVESQQQQEVEEKPAGPSRATVGAEIFDLTSRLGLGDDVFAKKVFELTKKKSVKELTLEEMIDMRDFFKLELEKQQMKNESEKEKQDAAE